MQDDGAFPRPWMVLTFASVGGLVGVAIAAAVTLQRQGGLLGDPDSSTRMIADNTYVLAWMGLAAGVGWLLGCLIGWGLKQRMTPPSVAVRWWLRAVAMVVAAIAAFGVLGMPSADDVRRSDTSVAYDIASLTSILAVTATIVIVTLLLLARRSNTRRYAAVAGVAIAVAAVAAMGLRVGSLPTPEQAWLEHWLATRQAPLGAAPNLLDPAPKACAPRSPEPFPDEERSFGSDVPPVYYWINPWAPRWLPRGFGLAMDRSWPWPRPHGVWTDERCREITLFMHGRRDEVAFLEGVPLGVGSWTLTTPTWCSADAECLEYRVAATIDGSDEQTLIVLRTVDLSRAEAARVARSIPTDRAPYL